jgi:hypothetical protein
MPSRSTGAPDQNAKIRDMRTTSLNFLTAVLLLPLAAHADDIDLPELGVRLTALPSSATQAQAQVSQHPSGYDAVMRLGIASLTISREDDPVPPGSDVADPRYRAQLDRRYRADVESKALGAPTSVGGHNAWTVVDAREQGSAALTHYTCLTYVIVDQHLYRLAVTADGSPGRPPEFDALVKALSGVTFELVRRAAHS